MTVTLYPTRRIEYNIASGLIVKVSSDNSEQVTVNRNIGVIYEFDTSGLGVYGRTSGDLNQQVNLTLSRRPTSDTYTNTYFLYKNVDFAFEVGNVVQLGKEYTYGRYDSQTGKYIWNGYIVSNESNKFYVRISLEAYNWNGGVSSLATDQTFIFSGTKIATEVGTDIPFTARSSFGGGYQNPNDDLKVQVSAAYNSQGIKQYVLASAVLHYKKKNSSNYTDVNILGNEITLPAGTFENGTEYDVYLTANATSGATANTAVVTLTTIDAIGTVTGVSPSNDITYGEVNFQWNYSVSTGANQYAYDLQISSNNGVTWETIFNHVISSDTSAVYGQSAVGATLWRVRGYNQNDVASAWSEPLYYLNNVSPEAPSITAVNGSGRQTVSWSAEQQIAYEVKVLNSSGEEVYTTGEVYSTGKTALINEYLDDGTYTFAVRIAAGFGKWSEWSEIEKTISASLADPQFTVVPYQNSIVISISQNAAYDHVYILKNGIPIAKAAETYTDYYVNGDTTYKVIGVGSDDSYGYAYKAVSFKPLKDYFVTRSGNVFDCNLRWDNIVLTEKMVSPKIQAYEMLGEKYPTHFINSVSRTQSYTVSAYDENNSFEDLIGDYVYFSTKKNGGSWCVVTGLNRSERRFGSETALNLETDSYKEAIEYDL